MENPNEIIKQVRKLEIKTKILVDGLLQGAYHSTFKGRGIEFSEVREYNPGDDIRSIDWNVTARMGFPYVKEYIEERDLTVYFVFDISSSNEFGSTKRKKEAAIELIASLLFSAMKNNDNTGLFLFTNKIERYIPARKGKRHAFKILREILLYKPKEKTTDLDNSLKFISRIIKKRSVVFIVSDFMTNDFSKSLKMLKSRNDIICINLNDIREQEIPRIGYIRLEDEETGERILVNTNDPVFRANYSNILKEKNKNLEKTLKKLNIDIINLLSDEPYEIPLKKFFRLRCRRIR
ncbi:MAG: DUF58 domain-containing protein [Candidatus Pacearchaeota archaeon]|jgi:uncharacterized protein (DUF58 family)